ncbi:putative exported domain protein [Bacteroides fragilis str. 3988T(B)14]|uniref:Putative exported domain protein n=1 Tax=Bacteroides fragilis str. 3988T(B)14 TaxID=1339315 RepID=A0A015UR85_BACFG|nr:putative exported domain protein [Bacteroides fragilis str. 3988T(B)14]EXY79771.1 putative exported domain protein [Bacteroides fragilis str. 3988 T1]EYA65864.1 putative exported domain protein [Bacteroides fragilis str. S23L24]
MNLYHDQVKRKYNPLDHCRSLYTFDSMSGPIPGISSFGIGQGASCSVSGGIPG